MGVAWAQLGRLWDAILWVLLVGFLQATTLGFAIHLFPSIARHPLPGRAWELVPVGLLESSVIAGTVALAGVLPAGETGLFALSALFLLLAVAGAVVRFAAAVSQPSFTTLGPDPRPGDRVTPPLFLASWALALAASLLFLLSAFSLGPGFGWWVAGVHLLVLGHASVLVAAISLRLIPRSLGADPPRALAAAVGGSAVAGGLLVPLGMLAPTLLGRSTLPLFAAPEALFALLLLGMLGLLGLRARTPRRPLALQFTSVLLLLVGGGLGLVMVSLRDYSPFEAHALVNLLGFLGLTILVMWFGMIAPFQRISHNWTRRMLWAMSGIWVGSTALLSAGVAPELGAPKVAAGIGATLLLASGLLWSLGSLSVLYPSLNPLPGVTRQRIREAQRRWSGK